MSLVIRKMFGFSICMVLIGNITLFMIGQFMSELINESNIDFLFRHLFISRLFSI